MAEVSSPVPTGAPRKDSVAEPSPTFDYDEKLREVTDEDPTTRSGIAHVSHMKKKARRKEDSLFETCRHGIVDHQLGLSINGLLLLALTHLLFPRLRSKINPFFSLSYFNPKNGLYATGPEDFKYVSFWVVVFTGLRVGTMDYILIPWAKSAGLKKKKATIRFAEQAWLLIYVSVFWTTGMYLYFNSPYFGDLRALWVNFPDQNLSGLMKWYYLAQFAFWLQQIVVVNIEDRRKDHWQMFTHHIITSALILFSYGYYQFKVGHVILCIMDVVDLFLPIAKMLNYLKYQTACDVVFGIFILTWFVARHVCFIAVCWSTYVHSLVYAPPGCYDGTTGKFITNEDVGQGFFNNLLHAWTDKTGPVCAYPSTRNGFLILLSALQVITILWFGMILRVAYMVIVGKGAGDVRSDDEEDEEEEVETRQQQKKPKRAADATGNGVAFKLSPKEEEVGVEQLRFVRRNSPPKTRKSKGMASGISIPGHGDKKELLGRIGCDKPDGPS